MAWVRLEDGFFSNPKVLSVSPLARLLYVASLCHGCLALTDGRIDAGVVPILHAQSGTKRAHTAELVEAGLWVEGERDGYVIPDFLEYQRSRTQVLAEREAARERQAKFRGKSRTRNAVTSTSPSPPLVDSDESTLSPLDSGEPVDEQPAPDNGPDDGFEEFWQRYPTRDGRRQGKREAQTKCVRRILRDQGVPSNPPGRPKRSEQ